MGEAFSLALSTKLAAIVGHCFPIFTDLKESIRPFADLRAEVKCPNASLTNAFSLNSSRYRDAL